MALLSVIRRWHFREEISIREIERRTGLSRNTIRKYLRAGAVEPNKRTGQPNKLSPVNNIADFDNLWRGIAPRSFHRCLIPMTGFAEAEGPDGNRTRSWFTHKDCPLFAQPGMWRNSEEWGPVYSGLMTSPNKAIRPLHDRRPVLVDPAEYETWLNGTLDDVIAFRNRIYLPAAVTMRRADELWLKRKPAPV